MLNKIIPLGIPLAWLNLVKEKKRFLAAVAGITFAVTMMLFQMGLNSALFTQVVAPLLKMNGDIVMVSKQYEYFGVSEGFPRHQLARVQGHPDVVSVAGLYAGSPPMLNPDTGATREVFAIAFDPREQPFADPQIISQQHKLKRNGIALYDALSRDELGPFVQKYEQQGEVVTQVAGRRITVAGLFDMGATFVADGNMLMNPETFFSIWPFAEPGVISLGLIKLRPGADAGQVAHQLREYLPEGIRIHTMEDFIANEKAYWSQRTPIGFVITASMMVALIVGAVIVYQILYTDVTDHLQEYATLKSIGYKDSYFIGLVLQESVILSIAGFIPGTLLTAGLYYLTREMANMPTYLTVTNCLIVLAMTLVMCGTAGALATRKLRSANPAELF